MIGRRLGIPGRDLSEAMENLDDLLEMVVETSQVFCFGAAMALLSARMNNFGTPYMYV